VSVDFLPVTKAESGNKKTLVLVDHLTRYVEAFACAGEKAETAVKHLCYNTVCRCGCSEELLSDQGPAYTSEVIKELCRIMGVKKICTSPYHPASNGLVERMNSTLVSTLPV